MVELSTNFSVDAFLVKIRQAFQELDTLGYTVIEDVVAADHCAEIRESLHEAMQARGVNYDAPNFAMSQFPQVHGIVQHLGIGQSSPIWRVRNHQQVVRPFEEMYGTNDLLVSFDAMCIMPPHFRARSGHTWWHVDQSHRRLGRRCIQGYVNLTTSHDERSGSLAVIPRSHSKHAEFARVCERANESSDDWFKYTPEEFGELMKLCGRDAGDTTPTLVHGKVGSLVLWDSRTAHMAVQPPNDGMATRERCIVYVCYQPRSWITAANLTKKQRAFDEFRMTTHWPASQVKLFPQQWRTWGKPVPQSLKTNVRDRGAETPRMLELAGKTNMTTAVIRHWTPGLSFVKN